MPKTCFFISPIGDAVSAEREFSDKLLKYIIAPVLEKCEYGTPVRADHITQSGVITTQVFTHLWNVPNRERTWLRTNRPKAAAHWSLLTGLTAEQLPYAAH